MPTLDVVEDRLDALLATLFHTSNSSSPEEHLGVAESPLVIHRLDGGENDLGAFLQVRHGGVHFLWLDDDETVDKVGIDSPVKMRNDKNHHNESV